MQYWPLNAEVVHLRCCSRTFLFHLIFFLVFVSFFFSSSWKLVHAYFIYFLLHNVQYCYHVYYTSTRVSAHHMHLVLLPLSFFSFRSCSLINCDILHERVNEIVFAENQRFSHNLLFFSLINCLIINEKYDETLLEDVCYKK